jgi:hypothetical protein
MLFIILVLYVCVDITYPIIRPINIIVVGKNLLVRGIIATLLLIGDNQESIAPLMVDMSDSVTIGMLMFFSSVMYIHVDLRLGDIMVAIVNRIE